MTDYHELIKALFIAYLKETGHSPISQIINHLSASDAKELAKILIEVRSEFQE